MIIGILKNNDILAFILSKQNFINQKFSIIKITPNHPTLNLIRYKKQLNYFSLNIKFFRCCGVIE